MNDNGNDRKSEEFLAARKLATATQNHAFKYNSCFKRKLEASATSDFQLELATEN